MRIRWFGKSWGAPICGYSYQVPAPVGELCLSCRKEIVEGERGFVMAGSMGIDHTFTMEIDGKLYSLLCAYHVDCFLESILPGESTIARVP